MLARTRTAHPVRFLYTQIKKSKKYPKAVKTHVLRVIRPLTETRSVPIEQLILDADMLHSYANWCRSMYELNYLDVKDAKTRAKHSSLVHEIRSWGVALSKCPSSKGLAKPKNRHRRKNGLTAGRKEIPQASGPGLDDLMLGTPLPASTEHSSDDDQGDITS